VRSKKAKKINYILNASDDEILKIDRVRMPIPDETIIYPSLQCSVCKEKVIEPMARLPELQKV
jgi:formylmethanofuran dehydrogenase subunit E